MMRPKQVSITDTTLRDGDHAMSHQFTVEQGRRVAQSLDEAGVPVIEVSHGDGLGGLLHSIWFFSGAGRAVP